MEDHKLDSNNSTKIEGKNENTNIEQLNRVKIKSSYIVDLLAITGVLIITMIISSMINGILTDSGSISRPFGLFLSYTIPFLITIIFAIWLFMSKGYKNTLPKFSIKSSNAPFVLYGCTLTILSSAVLEPLINLFPKEWISSISILIEGGGWSIITAVAMAPILEEILFRGIIQGSATSRYGALRGILISSTLFGLVHIIPQQVVYAFVIGLILGYIYWKTQSIISVIIIHAFNNGLAYIQSVIFADELADVTIRTLIKNDTLYWISYSIITILFISTLVMLLQQVSKKDALAHENGV